MARKKAPAKRPPLTEAEWLDEDCWDPYAMLYTVGDRLSARKARLCACAFVRRDLGTLPEPWQRRAVEVGERYADGQATDEELEEAGDAACGQFDCSYWAAGPRANDWTAAEAAGHSLHQDRDLMRAGCVLLRCLLGNPFAPVVFDPAWRTADVLRLAETVYRERAFDRLPVLADLLEEAGATDARLLGHLRGGGRHWLGCFALDAVLGKG